MKKQFYKNRRSLVFVLIVGITLGIFPLGFSESVFADARVYLESDIFAVSHSERMNRHPLDGSFLIDGVVYGSGLSVQGLTDLRVTATYNITGRGFTRLSGVFGFVSATIGHANVPGLLTISGDGALIGSFTTNRVNGPVHVDVNIPANVQEVVITIQINGWAVYGFGNVFFSSGEAPVMPVHADTQVFLESDIFAISHSERMNRHPLYGSFLLDGVPHGSGLSVRGLSNLTVTAVYNISGRGFTRLSGVFGFSSATIGHANIPGLLTISGDGALLGSFTTNRVNGPVDVDVEIPSNVHEVVITIQINGWATYGFGSAFFEGGGPQIATEYVPEPQLIEVEPWQEGFIHLLRDYARRSGWANYGTTQRYAYFALHDIDGDGVPEVLVISMEHSLQSLFYVEVIYAFRNGNVVSLDWNIDGSVRFFGLLRELSGSRPGIIVSTIIDYRRPIYFQPDRDVFVVSGGATYVMMPHESRLTTETTFSSVFYDLWDEDYWGILFSAYFINGQVVSQSEHQRVLDNYLGNRINIHELTEDNILNVWEQYTFYERTFFLAEVYEELNEVVFEEEENFLAQSISTDLYIHTYTPPLYTFTSTPATLATVHDASTAQAEIRNTLSNLTPTQRQSGDALNTATLHIENLARRGTTQNLPTGGGLSASLLQTSAGTAYSIRQNMDEALAEESLVLMRNMRTNLNFVSEETDEITVVFPDELTNVEFDNVTIESGFAAVTLNREHIPQGGEITVNRVEALPVILAAQASGNTNGGNTDYDDVDGENTGSIYNTSTGGNSPASPIEEIVGIFTDFSHPVVILANFWSLLAIVVLVFIWIILAVNGKKFRLWVVPTFTVIFIVANVGTVFVRNNISMVDLFSYIWGAVIEGTMLPLASITSIYTTETVEVTMTEGMRAILSLPINGKDPVFLVTVNEYNEIQHSRFNPVTETIDARIRTSGTYTLRDNHITFADIHNRSQMMQNAILQLASRGIMRGAEYGYFYPDNPISRGEFVSTLVMAFDMLDFEAQAGFVDINPGDWYYHAIATAINEGLVVGFPEDNTFRGGLSIPKDQLVVVSARTLVEQMGYFIPEDIEYFLARFFDRNELAYWSEGGIALATKSNVLIHRVDGLFAPESVMTRGDAAIILYRIFNRVW